ncbi:MAG: Gfo/Idh/MocA family oxidoreductase [Planctomycetota bacterium]
MSIKPQVCIVGGGMITQVQILPSFYQLQRLGLVGDISICALNSSPLKTLAEDDTLNTAFPDCTFTACPSLDTDPAEEFPGLFREVIAKLPQQSIVVVAMPDQLHYMVIKEAMKYNHHICSVKPLVLKYDQAVEIEKEAYDKGLVVGIEYHKRLDDRALIARQACKAGRFGRFRLAQAALHECWYYRHSNFQNWCTCENSDMFSYVACHYVDQVHFITGLLPKYVSVYGLIDKYPNGNEGYLWTDGRVIWENGACLNVQNSLGYPDDGPGGNWQGIKMFFAGDDKGAIIFHDDQYRGVKHACLQKGDSPGDTIYTEPSPDYFRYVSLGGKGLVPVGYGYRSVELIVKNILSALGKNLPQRQEIIKQIDEDGVMATPRNSAYNELVMEAGRLSILNKARDVEITYGKNAAVRLRKY